MAEQVEAVIPPQHKGQPIYDFRNAAHGPRGYKCVNKRKLDEYEDQVEADEAAGAMQTDDAPISKPLPKRQRTNNVVGVGSASGRPWKSPGERAGALKNPLLSTSWEKKMKLKAESKAFKTFKKEAIAAHKEKLEKKKQQRNDAKARKEVNQKKNNLTQAVNNSTLRRMMKSKKQRKLLQKEDTLKQ